MSCVASLREAGTAAEAWPGTELPAEPRVRVRDRQAAAWYLRAAALAENAPSRELLRRHAARLIWPLRCDRGR
jgi:hypothetical protein